MATVNDDPRIAAILERRRKQAEADRPEFIRDQIRQERERLKAARIPRRRKPAPKAKPAPVVVAVVEPVAVIVQDEEIALYRTPRHCGDRYAMTASFAADSGRGTFRYTILAPAGSCLDASKRYLILPASHRGRWWFAAEEAYRAAAVKECGLGLKH